MYILNLSNKLLMKEGGGGRRERGGEMREHYYARKGLIFSCGTFDLLMVGLMDRSK